MVDQAPPSTGIIWTPEEALRFASEPNLAEHFELWQAQFIAGGRKVEREEARDLRERVETAFLTAMRGGALSAWGQTAAGLVEIPPRAWVPGAIIDWQGSTLRAHGVGRFEGVRLVPWLHLPDIATRMAGLTLQDAFRRFVRGDLEVTHCLRWASIAFVGDYSAGCDEVNDGWFTASSRLWPASLDDYDLAVEWMDTDQGTFAALEPSQKRGSLDYFASKTPDDRKAFAAVRAAETVIRDRFNRLLAPLRAGAVEAAGQLRDGSALAVVAQGIWARPRTRIDFVDGELHRVEHVEVRQVEGREHRGRIETTRLEWTGLTLRLPASASQVGPPAAAPPEPAPPEPAPLVTQPELKPRNLGGRKEERLWLPALDRLLDKLLEGDFPTGGPRALATLMLECFREEKATEPTLESTERWLRRNCPRLWARAKDMSVPKPRK